MTSTGRAVSIMISRFVCRLALPMRSRVHCESLRRSMIPKLRYLSTSPNEGTKVTHPSDNNISNEENPPSLLSCGLVSVISYGTTYMSFLVGIYMALESHVITPEMLGLDVTAAIDKVSTYRQLVIFRFHPNIVHSFTPMDNICPQI